MRSARAYRFYVVVFAGARLTCALEQDDAAEDPAEGGWVRLGRGRLAV